MARAAAAEWHASTGQQSPGRAMLPTKPPFRLGHPPYRGPLGKSVTCLPCESADLLEAIDELELEEEGRVLVQVQSISSPL